MNLQLDPNVKNTLVHEYKHVKDKNLSTYSYKKELRAIDAQQNHSSYAKTTEDYKKNVEEYKRRQEAKKP